MGFVFQEGALFDSMPVSETWHQFARRRRCEEESRAARAEVLQFVELEHALDRSLVIAGGMRPAVSIASALINPRDRAVRFTDGGTLPITAQKSLR